MELLVNVQTLNAGCLLAVGTLVLGVVGGFVLTVLELLGHMLKLGK